MPNITPLRAEDPDGVGRHRLTGRISGMPGAGPFYLATAADGTEVSLRLLRGTWTRDAAARDRFAAEAGSARRVPPFCAARILDAGVEQGYAYLVSEYIAGKSLLETVSDDGKLSGPELEALALGSATGLASVHQAGLVHGSFGPEYVLLSEYGPRIIEFGITPPYGSATPSADMLAWAQTMVFASMGRPPATLADLDVLPWPLRQAVADCLTGDPALRPAARSVVLELLDDAEPPAGALAEGSRRAGEATQAARAALADRESQSARGSRSGPGGRPGRAGGQRYSADGQRPRRQDQGNGTTEDEAHRHSASGRRRSGNRAGGGRAAGRRSGALPAAVAVLVIAVIGIVVVYLMQHAGSSASPSPNVTAQDPPTSSTSPVSSTGTADPPSAPATIPAAFTGSWSGQVSQVNPSDVFDVKLTLPAASSAGTITYSGATFSCPGELTLQGSGDAVIVLKQAAGKPSCANGVVTLVKSGDGTLKFSFRGKSGPADSGTLTKS